MSANNAEALMRMKFVAWKLLRAEDELAAAIAAWNQVSGAIAALGSGTLVPGDGLPTDSTKEEMVDFAKTLTAFKQTIDDNKAKAEAILKWLAQPPA